MMNIYFKITIMPIIYMNIYNWHYCDFEFSKRWNLMPSFMRFFLLFNIVLLAFYGNMEIYFMVGYFGINHISNPYYYYISNPFYPYY